MPITLSRIFPTDTTRRSARWVITSSPTSSSGSRCARAYLHDPSILIVEEPKSPIDDDTKHFIDDTLSRLSIGRTLIILPHRLATFRSCDHVIVLQNGRVEDAGSPIQLQTESKLFRHLLYTEFNEFAGGEIEAGHDESRASRRQNHMKSRGHSASSRCTACS